MKGIARNEWYIHSLVNVHIDNHGSPVGKGQDINELTDLLETLPVTMLQVSAQSTGAATYPTEIGENNPDLKGYDTLAVLKEVTGRLGRKLCIYMAVDSRPALLKSHPHWAWTDADGSHNARTVCLRPNRQQKGFLYERFLPQIREIIAKYDPDGFWFDGDLAVALPCWCERCVAAWKEETSVEPPRDVSARHWLRWWNWNRERFDEYRRLVAECIHEASPKAIYASNWSWFRAPDPVPDWADCFTADTWTISDIQYGTMRWGAQQKVPWDIMSFTMVGRTFQRIHSLQRSLQEGALAIAAGGNWFVWGFGGGPVPPCYVEDSRHCAEFVHDRESALGPTVSLSQVAVLDSETSWYRGGDCGMGCRVDRLARALQESHYLTDIVNELTYREHLTPYKVVIVPDFRYLAPETLSDLVDFVEEGGLLVLTGAALRPEGEGDDAQALSLLGLDRSEPCGGDIAQLCLGGQEYPLTGIWGVVPESAEVCARFTDGRPALTCNRLGQGTVAYLATSDLRYPDDGFMARVLRLAGAGPSYSVHGAPEPPLVCSLRGRSGQVILHVTDLSTRSNGKMVELDSTAYTELNPALGNLEVNICLPEAPDKAYAVPTGTPVETEHVDGILTVRFGIVQTHAAVVLSTEAQPPFELLPAETPLPEAMPHVDEMQVGVLLEDDFEGAALGCPPPQPWVSEMEEGASVAVTDETAALGERSLRLSAAGGAKKGPSVSACWRPFRKGTARLSCDMKVDAGAACELELRHDGIGTMDSGPSLAVNSNGDLLARNFPMQVYYFGSALSSGERVLMTIPPNTWFHLVIDMRLGMQNAGYTLAVTVQGQEPRTFTGLCLGQWFLACQSVHFVGARESSGSFYVDNVKFERLTVR